MNEETILVEAGWSKVMRELLSITCSSCQKHFYSEQYGAVACPFCGLKAKDFKETSGEAL